jgi:hypothetical protein
MKKLHLIIFFSSFFAFATISPTLNVDVLQDNQIVIYKAGSLIINGFNGPGEIEIYSIIGNKINSIYTQELFQFNFSFSLESGNMFIVRINNNNKVKTFKIIAS